MWEWGCFFIQDAQGKPLPLCDFQVEIEENGGRKPCGYFSEGCSKQREQLGQGLQSWELVCQVPGENSVNKKEEGGGA